MKGHAWQMCTTSIWGGNAGVQKHNDLGAGPVITIIIIIIIFTWLQFLLLNEGLFVLYDSLLWHLAWSETSISGLLYIPLNKF